MARAFPDPVGARLAQLHTMKTTHTPGPWGLRHSGKTVVSLPHTSPEAREVIACSIENTANARLIAAAPELLDALEEIARRGPVIGCNTIAALTLRITAMQSMARSAIARATQP